MSDYGMLSDDAFGSYNNTLLGFLRNLSDIQWIL